MTTGSSDASSTTATTWTAARVRSTFIDSFVERFGHVAVASSPAVPHDDPTLLFTNAGMNQFKDVFLGQGSRSYARAVDTQKCIRAGGKHNDLEDVGRDTYHHTFFEMLGNWSFGDYFKTEAIDWAWTLLTEVYGIPADRLYATYFGGDASQGLEPDEEAKALWLRYLPESHVLPGDMKDNFWEMGESGPCGPCSEIHFDRIGGRNAAHLVNQDDPDVLEVWNLVFIQFNRETDGTLKPLPAKHVDTGMGLERLVSVLQDRRSNYDTDLFTPIFDAIRSTAAAQGSTIPGYGGVLEDATDVAYRVIADHVRCLVVAIADGATPGADGRGYVLRRILRRAVRHGRQTMGMNAPFMADLVPTVAAILGDTFPEMRTRAEHVAKILRDEEVAFRRTLDRGLALFAEAADEAARAGATEIDATNAFRLHDTFGFPIDLTQVMAEERGMTVDLAGYERLMETARETSRSGGGEVDLLVTMPPDALAALEQMRVDPTNDAPKFEDKPITETIRAIWTGREFEETADLGARVALIFETTNFYGEQGGQIGDRGRITISEAASSHRVASEFEVEDTRRVGPFVLHVGHVAKGRLGVRDLAELRVDRHRRAAIRSNHTATHLLNLALREVAGRESDQRGSLVAPDRLRFDYAASRALTPEEIADVERRVIDRIDADLEVCTDLAALEPAQRIGALRAVFGERYPDPVRVVSIGAPVSQLLANPDDDRWNDLSIEFCGGTHLERTGAAGAFVLLSEQGLAAGVRRVTALTGNDASVARAAAHAFTAEFQALADADDATLLAGLDALTRSFEETTLGAPDRHRLESMLDALRDRAKTLRKAESAAGRGAVVERAKEIAAEATGAVIVERLDGADKDGLLAAMDAIRAKHADAAVLLLAADTDENKVAIVAKVPDALIKRGLKAGDWVKAAAQACGGGGGGRPDSAQAGGKDASKADDAIAAATELAATKLG